MKKILFTIEGLWEGGTEHSLYNLIESLLPKYEIGVISVVDGPMLSKFSKLPISIKILCPDGSFRGKHRLISWIIRYFPARFVYRLFVPRGYDYEVAYHSGQPVMLIRGSDSGAETSAYFHMGFPADATPCNIDNYLNNGDLAVKVYRSFDKLVCVSQKQKETLNRLFRKNGTDMSEKIEVRHNVLNVQRILALSKEFCGVNKNGLVLLACGRLSPEKGFDRLILLAAELKEKISEFEIWLVGEGEQKKELEESAKLHNVLDRIRFLDHQQNPYKFMDKADYVICPSRYESYGLVVAEALAIGKVVIASRCEGTEELLENHPDSWLIDNDDKHFAKEAAEIIFRGQKK